MRFPEILSNHRLAIFLAFLVATIVASPQIYFRYQSKNTYQGIDLANTPEEKFYLARIQEAKEGHFNLSGSFFKEGKKDPYLQPPLGEILVALLGKIFFLNLNNNILLARLLFSFLAFLLVYAFALLVSKKRLIALSSSTAVFLSDVLISRQGFFRFLKILKGESPTTNFLNFSRPVHPQIDFLFFFSFLTLFWLFYTKKHWHWGILSVLVLGLSFYVYPYLWIFLYAFLGIFLLILFFQKKWAEIKRIIFISLLGILIGIPYFLNFYKLISHPNFADLFNRLELIETRQPFLPLLAPILLIIFLVLFPKEPRERYFFFLALILTPFLVYNQQLITGRDIQPFHFWFYFHVPLAIIILMVILFSLFPRNFVKLKKVFSLLIIIFSIWTGIIIQRGSYEEHKIQALETQRYGPILEWLNKNTQKEEVVFSDPEISNLIPIYTSLNVFYATPPDYLAASKERLIDVVFLFYRLEGLEGEKASETFLKDRAEISGRIFGVYWREKKGDFGAISDEILYSLSYQYQDFLKIPLDKILTKYNIKYVIWDNQNYPNWFLDRYPPLRKVYEKGNIKIFEEI